jgi:ABC-type nitrate/sulfonate/bicarbonate transport system permease component
MRETGRWAWRLGHLVLAGTVLAVWEAVTATGMVDPVLLPAPSAVALRLVQWAGEPEPYRHLAVTAFEVLMGYVFGGLFGGLAGLALSQVPRFAGATLDAADTVAATVPLAAAPLIVLWMGPGVGASVWLAALFVGLASLVEVRRSLLALDPAMVANVRMLGAGRIALLRHLLIPAAEERLLASLRPAVRRATAGALICEFLGARSGLGSLALHSAQAWDTAGACAAIVILAGAALLADRFLARTESRLASWRFRPAGGVRDTPLFRPLEGG